MSDLSKGSYKQEFVKLLISEGVLTFGEFTLKSGRVSPYFLNMGKFDSRKALSLLGEFFCS